MPHKIVISTCYGGFGLSEAALIILRGIGVMRYDGDYDTPGLYDEYSIPRHHPDLVRVIELLGEKEASGRFAELCIVEIDGDKYHINEYDGYESIVTPQDIGHSWINVND